MSAFSEALDELRDRGLLDRVCQLNVTADGVQLVLGPPVIIPEEPDPAKLQREFERIQFGAA